MNFSDVSSMANNGYFMGNYTIYMPVQENGKHLARWAFLSHQFGASFDRRNLDLMTHSVSDTVGAEWDHSEISTNLFIS